MSLSIALLGNPNSGKTSLFNLLAKTHYHVANYPGVTTQYKIAEIKHNDETIKIIDLPGIYSLEGATHEEDLVLAVLKNEHIDIIVNVLDASNLERNLFLTKELLFQNIPIILALNIVDLAEKRGISINEKELSKKISLPIVKTNAKNGHGKTELLDSILFLAKENNIDTLLLKQGNSHLKTLASKTIIEGAISRKDRPLDKSYFSDKVDKILTHQIIGPLFLLAILYFSYQLVFIASEYPISLLESLFAYLENLVSLSIDDGLLKSLLISGVIDGVGGVLGFTPLILLMFFLISILEDSGYLARMALIVDRPFKYFNLEGASVFPYIISGGIAGGCAVPGVMASRGIRGLKERMLTMLTIPFMICGAKLPVFALLVAILFPTHKGEALFCITLLGWILALISSKILSLFIKDVKSSPFILELPPYRMPTLRNVLLRGLEKTLEYIKKAGTIILMASIVFWALMTFPQKEREPLKSSLMGQIGLSLNPISQLAGFDWKINIALISGIGAKELIVSSLGTVYSLSEEEVEDIEESEDAKEALVTKITQDENFSFGTGLSLIIFIMIYFPCLVTLITMGREMGSFKWPLISALANSFVAFTLAVFIYQIYRLGITWFI